MTWAINYSKRAVKTLAKMDATTRKRLLSFIDDTLSSLDNPKQQGKALTGKYKGLWRYRVGDYRLICSIEEGRFIILILELGHRKEIYK